MDRDTLRNVSVIRVCVFHHVRVRVQTGMLVALEGRGSMQLNFPITYYVAESTDSRLPRRIYKC